MFWRYLMIPLYFLILAILIGFSGWFVLCVLEYFRTFFTNAPLFDLITRTAEVIISSIMGIIFLFLGISFVGNKIMQLSPNKIVFWAVVIIEALFMAILYILVILLVIDSAGHYIFELSFWIHILTTCFVIFAYSYGGYSRLKEET